MKTGSFPISRKFFAVSLFLAGLIFANPLYAARILVVGDSWGVAAGPALQVALVENGSVNTVASMAVGGETAANLSTPARLADITTALNQNTDATLVHLSIGGNDFLGNWNAALSSSAEEALITGILADVTTIVNHILQQRPDIRIYWSSYDFPRPLLIGTPEEVNQASKRFAQRAEALALSKGPALTFGDFNGMTQVEYGFDGVQVTIFDPPVAIPAGDPSLPDPKFPGPAPAYADPIHLTAAAYLMLAGKQYDQFYAFALGERLFQINAGLNDAWFNPATNGQGFFITVFPNLGLLSLAWFTYDTTPPAADAQSNLGDPGHRWLTAVGSYADDRAVLDVFNTSGGLFDNDTQVTQEPYGTMVVHFIDCNAAVVEYDIPSIGLQGTIPVRRVAGDNIPLCEALQSSN